jgi:hypothetical protein
MRRTLIVTVSTAVVLFGSAQAASAADNGGSKIYLSANGAQASSAAVRPHTAPISRDSSLALSEMSWTSWGDRANGTGIATINLCDPYCAAGKYVNVPVAVELTAPRSVCGRDFYTDMRLTLDGEVPAGLTRTTSVPVEPIC